MMNLENHLIDSYLIIKDFNRQNHFIFNKYSILKTITENQKNMLKDRKS